MDVRRIVRPPHGSAHTLHIPANTVVSTPTARLRTVRGVEGGQVTMSKRKYGLGKQICSISDFDHSENKFYIVYFGPTNPRTIHRSFLISWQYRTLLTWIVRGWVFEADFIKEATNIDP